MKIENKKNTVANIDGVQKCQIAVNGKMFSMLSEKLYSNPIKAVVRELSCNAVDAHRDAGNQEAFNVNLPTELAPTFEVQDFGIGMSKDQIITLYNTYGASTKEDSNEVIGGFGIGSKSPFAYTDQFTVESIKDGKKVTAMNWLSEDKIPVFKILSETNTDEHNGTKISVPVKPEDINVFIKAAFDVYLFLDMMPNIIQGRSVFYSSFSIKENEDPAQKFEEYRKNPSVINSRTRLVMGGVEYLIDYHDLVRECFPGDDYSISSMLYLYFNNRQFSAPIGSISIPPSREMIIFDKRTVNFFRQYLYSHLKDLAETPLSEDDYVGLMNLVEKYSREVELLYKVCDDMSDINKFIKLDDECISNLKNIMSLRDKRDTELNSIKSLSIALDKSRRINNADKIIYKGSINSQVSFRLQQIKSYFQPYILTVMPQEIFDKIGKGLNSYRLYTKKSLNKDTLKVINAYDKKILAVTAADFAHLRKYLPEITAIEWKDLSRKEYKIKRTAIEKKIQDKDNIDFWLIKSINIKSNHKVFQAGNLDELRKAAGKQIQIVYALRRNEGLYFIPKDMEKKDITVDKLKLVNRSQYGSFFSELNSLELITKKKIMIIQLDYAAVKKHELYKNIENIEDFFKGLIKSRGLQKKLKEIQVKYENYINLCHLKEFFEIVAKENSNLLFKSVLDLMNEGKEDHSKWSWACDLFRSNLEDVNKNKMLFTQIFNRYPLLDYCPRYLSKRSSDAFEKFGEYVALVDSNRELSETL